MSHKIEASDKIVYAKHVPWHGIGTKVDEVLTASEAILIAKLNWIVDTLPIYDKNGKELTDYKAVTRVDTGEVYQIASKGYTPVQNVDAFRLVDEITGTGLAKYDVVGTLKGGRVLFITLRLPYDFSIGGKDEVKSYLNFFTSHDGSLALQGQESPIRVVCWNTVQASLSQKTSSAYAKHTVNVKTSFKSRAEKTLARAQEYFAEYKEAAQALAKKQFTSLAIDSFLAQLFETEGKKADDISTKTTNIQATIKRLHDTGKGSELARGTGWGVFNAVTEYIDWEKNVHGNDQDNRLSASWLGSGSVLRQKAFALLTK